MVSIPPHFKKGPPPKKKRKRLLFIFLVLCFLCAWLVTRSVLPQLPEAGAPPRLYSNQCRQDLRLTLIEAMRRAQASIYLVMFGLSDAAILHTLGQKIEQGTQATVYYDPNASPQLRSALQGADLHAVHQAGLMHQKILILDDDLIFIGSANMTTASLRMHDNLVVGLRNREVARFLREKIPHHSGYLRTLVGGQDIELWLLPDPRGHALADLKRHIHNASKSVQIALFTFTHPALVEEVIAAKERGVSVTLVVDLHGGLGASAKAISRLKEANVRVLYSQGVQLLHHKFILIDDTTLLCGSANWTKAAFYKNSDCILVLHQLNGEQKNFMKRLWHRIEAEAKANPARS